MNPGCTITHAMTQGLALIERARDFLKTVQLSESWVRQMTSEMYICDTFCDMVRKLKPPIDLSTENNER